MLLRCLSPQTQLQLVRHVSSKYTKPHPRTYKRRLFEAAVAPIMPPSIETCATIRLEIEREKLIRKEYAPIEIALVNKVRNWIQDEKFRVLAVCQLQPIGKRTLHFAKNQLRLEGVELRDYPPHIMRKVFEGTPLEALKPLFCSRGVCVLYGYEPAAIKVMVEDATKYNYIVPLCVTFDWRIIRMEEAKQIARYADIDDARAQTVGLLGALSSQLSQTLSHHSHDLVSTLGRISAASAEF